jgi:hypothetical protein
LRKFHSVPILINRTDSTRVPFSLRPSRWLRVFLVAVLTV